MATTHDHKHDTTPSEEGMGKTQGAVLAGIGYSYLYVLI